MLRLIALSQSDSPRGYSIPPDISIHWA